MKRPGDDLVGPKLGDARLQAWLEAARSAGVPSDQEAARDNAPERRAEHVRRLAQTIDEAGQRQAAADRRRARLPWYGFAAAACLLVVTTAIGLSRVAWVAEEAPVAARSGASVRQVVGTVIAIHPDGHNQVIEAEATVASGDQLSTTAEGSASLEVGKARIDLSNATTIELQELEAESQSFRLHAGRVDVSVPKVPGTQRRVSVQTHDALVTVHGTVFSVEVSQLDGRQATSVSVSRGLVSVDHDGRRVMLPAGGRWTSSEERRESASVVEQPTAEAEPAHEAPVGADTPEPAKPAVVSQTPRASKGPVVRSDLAVQNALFEEAMVARDAGNEGRAIALLRELMTTFPRSPLRTTAQAELRAALERQDADDE